MARGTSTLKDGLGRRELGEIARRIERELMAGPSRENIFSLSIKSPNARRRPAGVGCCLVSDWASTAAT